MIRFIILITLIGTILASCSEVRKETQAVFLYQNSVDIEYGSDICSFTGKPIETVRYGGKIVLKSGEVHKFMSVECVAGFYLGIDDTSHIASLEIVDFAHGQKYLPAEELLFLQSPLRPSPNGLFLTAVDRSNTKMKTYIRDAYPGQYLEWEEVLALVEKEWGSGSINDFQSSVIE